MTTADAVEFKFGQYVKAVEPEKSYTGRTGKVKQVSFRDANNTDPSDIRKRYLVRFGNVNSTDEYWLFAEDLEAVE